MKTRVLEDVDVDLAHMSQIASAFERGSEQWQITWERINELLEERGRFTQPDAILKAEVN